MALTPRGKRKKDDALRRIEPLDEPTSDLMAAHRQCTATSKRTGKRCGRFCAPGMKTCNMHGSATRRSKTAAAKRIAQASGYAADMLVEFMADPNVDIKLRTTIAQDLLSRANVSGKTAIELGVSTLQKHISDVIVIDDMSSYDDDPNVIDAEVVESYDLPFRPYRDEPTAAIAAPVAQPTTPPARRDPAQQPTPSAPPLSHGETYSERSERLNRESRDREMGRGPLNTGGARNGRADMGRPRR